MGIRESEPVNNMLIIRDIFSISERETLVCGTWDGNEPLIVGAQVTLQRSNDRGSIDSACVGVEKNGKFLSQASKGETVAVWLRGIERDELEHGDILKL